MSELRIAVICLLASTATVWAGPKIAVLEAIGPSGTPSARIMSWTDAVRGAVLAKVPPDFIVLTRSNIEAFLPPGVDLADCEGECEITTARKIGAEYVVSVRVHQIGSTAQTTVALHATIDGRFLGQGRQSVPLDQIDAGLRAAAAQAMHAIARLRPGPMTADAQTQATVVHARQLTWMGAPILRIESGIAAPLVIHARGRRVGTTPVNLLLDGAQSLRVRAEAPGHHAQLFRVETGGASGQTTLALASTRAKFTLDVPFDDVEVHVGGLSLQGRTHTVEAGTHRVEVMHPCLNAPAFDAQFEVDDAQVIEVPYTLTCGNVEVISTTPEARVFWDDEWHPLPFVGPIEPPKARTVRIAAPGYVDAHIKVVNTSVGPSVFDVALEDDWVDAQVRMMRWTGEACPAAVFVDDAQVGVTPWRGRVRAGTHRVHAACDSPDDADIRERKPGSSRSASSRTTRTFSSGGAPVDILFVEQGPRNELMLTTGAFNSSLLTMRWWTGPHRGWRPRVSLGLSMGGFGYRDDAAGGVGLEMGLGLPVTHWLELSGSVVGLIGTRKCSAAERARQTTNRTKDCAHGYGEARATLRLYLNALVLEGGWASTGQSYKPEAGDTRSGPYLGVGLSF